MANNVDLHEIREDKPCIFCEKRNFTELYRWPENFYDHKHYDTSSWDGRQPIYLRIVKCKNCSLVFTNPSFKKQYLNYVYPDDLIPKNVGSKSELLNDKKWDDIIEEINKLFNGAKNVTVCDIGTRYGILVEKLKVIGYDSFGVELNQEAVNYAKKIGIKNVFRGGIEDVGTVLKNLNKSSCNIFVLDDVLEHLVNPTIELKELSNLQSSGDYFILRQMNYDSLGRKLFGKSWYYFQPAAHMYFFNPFTINKLLDILGYNIIEIRKSNKILKPFIMAILKKVGIKRFKMPKFPNNKEPYLNRRNKLEDMFLVIAQKK